ncbi:MAG: MoxR family ATPase [Lewinellaceae bacterium]|nr:MoxR family ATPase [Lewinellaceae bacterium]
MKNDANTSYIPSQYVLPPGLLQALEGAITLGQPLLLTGEPGTGKTTLADWAVGYLNQKHNNAFHPEVLRFNTKTTSTARDLFYTYDALAHFQAANFQGSGQRAGDFIELQALGRAIAMSNPTPEIRALFRTELPEAPRSSVVLIDEVDKAPRDFTNDILDEIDNQRFFLREHNVTLERGPDARIVVVMTSNSEKNLPDPFLRRCAFYHIEFPRDERLREILRRHLGSYTPATEAAHEELLAFFHELRDRSVRKKPATAELIGWLRLLTLNGYFEKDKAERRETLLHNLSFLVKTQEDLMAARRLWEGREDL